MPHVIQQSSLLSVLTRVDLKTYSYHISSATCVANLYCIYSGMVDLESLRLRLTYP